MLCRSCWQRCSSALLQASWSYATPHFLASLPTLGVFLLSLGLLALAVALTMGPSVLAALLPSPEFITGFRQGVLRVATVSAFSLAAVAFSAAVILVLSSNAGRESALSRYLGSMLAIMGIGSILAFACGRIMSGVSTFSVWAILDSLGFPLYCCSSSR